MASQSVEHLIDLKVAGGDESPMTVQVDLDLLHVSAFEACTFVWEQGRV